MQNNYIEKYNRVYRESILVAYLFNKVRERKALIEKLIEKNNERRPHEALRNR